MWTLRGDFALKYKKYINFKIWTLSGDFALKYKKYINLLNKIIHLGAKNGPVGWNGLSVLCTHKLCPWIYSRQNFTFLSGLKNIDLDRALHQDVMSHLSVFKQDAINFLDW